MTGISDPATGVRGLLRGGAGYLVGEVGSRGLTFGVLLAVAPAMPPSSFAYVSLYVVLANIASMVVGLGSQQAVVALAARELPLPAILGTTLGVIAASGAVVVAILSLAAGPIGAFLGVPADVVRLVGLGGVAISMRTAYAGSLRARGMVARHAATQIAEALVGAVLIATILFAGAPDWPQVTLALLAGTLAVALVGGLDWARDPGLAFSSRLLSAVLRFSLPLIPHGAAVYTIATYSQIAVNVQLGSDAGGVFAYAARFGMAMLLISSAFAAAWQPGFLRDARTDAGRATVDRRASQAMLALGGLAVLLMVLLPVGAAILGGPAYREAPRLIPLMVYAYVWQIAYTFVLGYQLHHGRTGLLAAGTVGSLVAGAVVIHAFIALAGTAGAAVGTVIGYAILFLVQWALVARSRMVHPDIRFARIGAGVAAMAVLPIALYLVAGAR